MNADFSPYDPNAEIIVNPMFKPRDIYNLKAQMRRDVLGPLTPIQALIREFDEKDWVYNFQQDIHQQITHLFFIKGSSQTLLIDNHEVLIMDCTYKTNRYKMPLLVISGQTALHTTFYVAFCFLITETAVDYIWALQQLKEVYSRLEFPDSIILVSDMEKGLILASSIVFPNINHLLCIWHINQNVLTKCKKSFYNEEWKIFLSNWKSVIYAATKPQFWNLWEQFSATYMTSHEDYIRYLKSTYIDNYHDRFVACYTKKVLHFETTVTSREEGAHAVLKRQLGSSTGDLKLVVDGINLLLTNQYPDHLIAFEEAGTRFPLHLRKVIFQQLRAFISPYAQKKILHQYELLTG